MGRKNRYIKPLELACYEIGLRLAQALRIYELLELDDNGTQVDLRNLQASICGTMLRISKVADLRSTTLARFLEPGGCYRELSPLASWNGEHYARGLSDEFCQCIDQLAMGRPETGDSMRRWFKVGLEIVRFDEYDDVDEGPLWHNLEVLDGMLERIGRARGDVFDLSKFPPQWPPVDAPAYVIHCWWRIEEGLKRLEAGLGPSKSPSSAPRKPVVCIGKPSTDEGKSLKLNIEGWSQLGIGIDGGGDKFKLYLFNPCPEEGEMVDPLKAIIIEDRRKKQLFKLLDLLADSTDGRSVSEEKISMLVGVNQSLINKNSSKATLSDRGMRHHDVRSKRRRSLMASLGRQIKDLFSMDISPFQKDGDGYRALFLTQRLQSDNQSVIRFGFPR